jgi:hypothetical protein
VLGSRRRSSGDQQPGSPQMNQVRWLVADAGDRKQRTGTDGTELLRSAPGPCRNGQPWASAVTNGHRRFRRTAGRRLSQSCSWHDAGGRYRLWSRTSGFESLGHPTAARVARHRDAAEVAVRVAESLRAQSAPYTRPAVASGHVGGSGLSTLNTVAPTPPTRMMTPAPPSGATDSRWMRCPGI